MNYEVYDELLYQMAKALHKIGSKYRHMKVEPKKEQAKLSFLCMLFETAELVPSDEPYIPVI